MRGPGRALAAAGLTVWIIASGCGDETGAPPGGPAACPEGTRRAADGETCEPVVAPPPTCATDEVVILTSATCAPVGWSVCPAGFVADDSGYGCVAVVAAGPCEPGTRPVVGQTGCEPVGGTACPPGFEPAPGGWGCVDVLPELPCEGASIEVIGAATCVPVGDCSAAFPPADATLFVDDGFPDAALDATHFRTIGEAVLAAAAGAVIAVESGTYVEHLVLGAAVTVVGRCAAEVLVESTANADAGLRVTGGGAVEVRGVTVRGHQGGAQVDGGGELTLRDAVLELNRERGVTAAGAGTRVTLIDTVVRGTLPDEEGAAGLGLDVSAGAELRATGSAIVENAVFGVRVAGGATRVFLERSVVRDTRTDAANDFGVGMLVRQGASVEIDESVIAENHETGIIAFDAGTEVVLRGSIVRDTENSVIGYGRGIDVELGASVEIAESAVVGNREIGVYVSGEDSWVVLDDAVVRGTLQNPSGTQGTGLHVREGAWATVSRSAFIENHDQALFAEGGGSRMHVVDSIAAGTLPGADGTFGRGITVTGGGLVGAERTAIVDNREAGAFAIDPGSRLSLLDCVVARTAPDGAGKLGSGVAAQDGALGEVIGSSIAHNHAFGVLASGAGAELTVLETVIEDTRSQPGDGRFGRGVVVEGGATLRLDRVAVRRNTEVALFASGAGTSVTVDGSLFADTLPVAVGRGGLGMVAQGGATVTVASTAVSANQVAAVLVNGEGTSLTAIGSLLVGTLFGEGPAAGFGHGAVVLLGGALTLRGCEIRDSAGIALAFAGGSGTIASTLLKQNAIGMHAQDGTLLVEASEVPAVAGPLEVVVSTDTVFEGNATRVGTGTVPLPSPLE